MSLRRHPVRNLIFAALLFLLSGSLLSASGSASREQALASALRGSVQIGETSRDDLIRRFGQPATQSQLRAPGEVEVLGFNHEAIARPPFRLLPLLSFPRTTPADTYFEITDGIVTRYWMSAAR